MEDDSGQDTQRKARGELHLDCLTHAVQLARLPAQTTRIFLRGQAVPTRSLNQKPHLSCQFWFSTPKVRPDPLLGPRVVFAGWIDDYNAYRPHGAIGYLTPDELMGREPGLRPSGLTQEPSKTTLPEATQL